MGLSKHNFNDNKITLCFWNGQSICDKTQVINDFKSEHDIDIYLLAETWLSDTHHTKVITDLKENTCNFINYPRPYAGRGVVLGAFLRNSCQSFVQYHQCHSHQCKY